MTREAIYAALFARASAAAAFVSTGRRLVMWTNCAPESQPALFQRDGDEEFGARPAQEMPPRRVLEAELWIYAKLDLPAGNVAGAPVALLGDLIDAVEASLAPDLALRRQTLGGLVQHCWIEGKIMKDPGDFDGQAKALIPVRILIP